MAIESVVLVKPRGFCAGVERAIDIVERCLEIFGRPVYVKHEIVHNKHVVNQLEEKGAVTVYSIDKIPDGSILVFSAHGSPPEDYKKAKEKNLRLIDATCPLVTRVHIEVHRFAKDGYEIVYIGHKGHVEAVGVIGELPDKIHFVESVSDVKRLDIIDKDKIVYLTQTTLSMDETKDIVMAIKEEYPKTIDPPGSDICYATTNRQKAIKELAKHTQLILVVGSKTSSNSNRLVETARGSGVKSFLIDDKNDIDQRWLEGVSAVGISSGASAPEYLVQEVVDFFMKMGAKKETLDVIKEDMAFTMPRELEIKERF